MFDGFQEILLTGTTGCVWSAVGVGDQSIGGGIPGPFVERFSEAGVNK